MDREDRRRFFVIGSVFLEVVTPVFRRQLENNYRKAGFSCLQDFLNNQPVVHTLFHLNHRYTWYCCVDSPNCIARQQLPLYNYQWKLLYTENPGPGNHHCHCKYTAKPVHLDELDITLMGLILVNCFTLGPAEEQAVRSLRQYKNDYLSHNTNCGITEPKYNSLWPDLTYHVLQLDPTRQSDLEDMKNRPLDEQLCKQYYIHLLDANKRFEEIGDSLQEMNTSVQGISTSVHGINTSLQGIGWNLHGLERSVQGGNTTLQGLERSVQGGNTTLQEMNSSIQTINTAVQGIPVMNDAIQKLVYYAEKGVTGTCIRQNPNIQSKRQERKSYKLGQDIFYQHLQFTVQHVHCTKRFCIGNKAVKTDAGQVAYIHWDNLSIDIYNTDGSHVDTIPLQGQPWDITVVNNSTVAVTLPACNSIDIWNIHNKQKVKSIQLSIPCCFGITTTNSKLVVGCWGILLIIDPQTEKVEKTIDTGYYLPNRLCGSDDGIFYTEGNYYLYHYSHSNNKISKVKLPSQPCDMTILQDGSVYVLCEDRSVQHVSSDGKKYTQVTTKGLTSLEYPSKISYNPVQRKLVISALNSITVFQQY
ncbi:uncharacterized protein LOC127734606 isoform X1 [Mytilus californianus]|uniref:uncharacterized protein LOC127734606 isoform X1 n=1 Tax=Mytilus californianus TaxID=6549 RepID=UPI002246E6E8|nr:uncharacterized protein LOC127734606 isoform X1 [Mytilus californianus]XP_052100527.1 uncharacterized protein LOC127734606 isoform X1 [Mytilus californianus]